MITVLLVDDYGSFRKSLRILLETAEDIKVVSTASNGLEAVAKASFHCPDVAVIDISMPIMDGIETARLLRKHCANTRLMMLSILDSQGYVQRAIEVGATGFVLKDAIGEDLLAAIRAVHKGETYFSQKIAAIAQQYMDQKGQEH